MLALPDPKDRTFWKQAEKAYDQGPYFLAKVFCEHLALTQITWNLKIETLAATQDYIEHMFYYFCDSLNHRFAPKYPKAFLRSGLDLYKKTRRVEIEAEKQKALQEAAEKEKALAEAKRKALRDQIEAWHKGSVLTYLAP